VSDVAAIVPTRAYDASAGEILPTFTSSTTPTAAQVGGIIDGITTEIMGRLGEVPVQLATPVREGGGPADTPAGHCAAVGSAAAVELQFYPDQQGGSGSPAAMLEARYQRLLERLAGAAANIGDDGTPAADVATAPDYAFPASVATGRGTSTWAAW